MEQRILQSEAPDDRARYLRENAFKIEKNYSYTRELEESELQERKDNLSQNLIKIDSADQVLKAAKEIHSAAVKPLKEENKDALQEIRTRSEQVVADVFLIKDEHSERMGIYSAEGNLLMERGLLPEERQFSITDNLKLAK